VHFWLYLSHFIGSNTTRSTGLSAPIRLALWLHRRAKRSFLWSLFLLAFSPLSCASFPLLSLTHC